MITERILITVRTYPNLSEKYRETVCTAGINDQGEWRRLYPVPLRQLEDDKKYRTFDIVNVAMSSNPADNRAESRRPDLGTLRITGRVDGWQERRDWIVPTALPSMKSLRESGRTLAPIMVGEVLEFIAEPDAPEWTDKQKQLIAQFELFDGPTALEKIPFDFRLRWRDGDGEEHDSKFLDWEVGQTRRAYRHRYADPIGRMRDAWMQDRFGPNRDIWFFMGNYAAHRQHFGVCGEFTPPKEKMASDTLW